MAYAGLPFFFYHCSSLREEDEARETNDTVNANINASGDANSRHLNQVHACPKTAPVHKRRGFSGPETDDTSRSRGRRYHS
ncbi:hypothetical protein Esi_0192_0009 [Ectocarpus siliculosus]|uniref:Uncharacterized protein n=1 Tax=Ectocarpus siliculosus TaxID=2880 RepID=D8LHF8_ECTSI|nr:hypothetical protein Esi_0192_0009 [Ectocarpus siliculosus]|eukprot:CBN79109.1 hypothetical protein Esi_0192_0009 [Ectocarpus siliculosus]